MLFKKMSMREALHARRFGSVDKWSHYIDVYDHHFRSFQDRKITLLEIGVQGGGSLAMYQKYFHNVNLIGIDIDEKCSHFRKHGIAVHIGDQADPEFIKNVAAIEGPFDIIIDDGGHMMHQITTSFQYLFPHLNNGGLYVIEDLHAAYWPEFDGQPANVRGEPPTAIAYLKDLVDGLNCWAMSNERAGPFQLTSCDSYPFSAHIGSVHFYDSLCIVCRQEIREFPKSPERLILSNK